MMVTVVFRKRNIGSLGLLTAGGRDVIVNVSGGSPAMPSDDIVMTISIPVSRLRSKMSDVTIEKSFTINKKLIN